MAKDQTLKIIDMQSFIGWEADNPYMWPANCCARAVWVDLRSKPWLARLDMDVNVVKDVGYRNNILCVANIQEMWANADKIYMCYGNPSKLNIDNSDVDVYTFNHKIIAMCINEWEMYYFWTTWTWSSSTWIPSYKIHIYKSSIGNDWNPTNFTYLDGKSYDVYWKWWWIFALNLNTKIYVASGNKVVSIDDVEVLTDEISFPKWETIVWMTEYLWTIKIYTVIWENTYLYTWDWVDYVATTRQLWEWTKLVWTNQSNDIKKWVLNDWAYDYVLSENWDLYIVSWTQKQKIKTSNVDDANKKFLCLLKVQDGILYIWAEFTVYTYGIKYPWISASLVWSYVTPYFAGSSIMSFWPRIMCRNYIYNSYWVICTISDKYSNQNISSKLITNLPRNTDLKWWFIQTMYYTNDQWKDMAFEMMKLKVKTNNHTVLIYYRTDITEKWILFKTIWHDYKQEKITISIREFNENIPWPFTGIQFMFVLQQDEIFGSKYDTPEIWRCTVFLREINENK